MKHVCILFATLLFFLSIIAPTVANEADWMPDANLRTAVRSALSLADTAALTKEDMAKLKSLTAIDSQISSITGLEHATNLTSLNLRDNTISDISALSGLTNLTSLNLRDNTISDISALSGLTNLETLKLQGNTITDISALSGLTSLTFLNLKGNNISAVSALSGLTTLEFLKINENSITDVTPLATLVNLETLYLADNLITDLSPLVTLVNLTKIDFDLPESDTTAPDVSISVPSDVQTGVFDAIITFTEAVSSFDHLDVSLSGTATASITSFTTSDNTVFTAEITPTTSGEVMLDIDADVATGAASNGNTAATQQTVTVDVDAPTVMISAPFETQTGAFDATITFSEIVSGFVQSELSVSGDANASITNWSPNADNTVFTATITPTSSGTLMLDIAADVATDAVGNGNTAATQQTVAVTIAQQVVAQQQTLVVQQQVLDTIAPDVSIFVPMVPQNGAFDAIITFTEAVSDFESNELSLGGTATASITAWHTTDNTVFTATITPTTSGEVTLDIDADVATDAASNGNTAATQQTVVVDIDAPSVTLTLLPEVEDNRIDVTITFSEPVQGFESADVNITTTGLTALDPDEVTGEIPAIASITGWTPDVDGQTYTVYIATYTQTDGQVILEVPADVASDSAGNGNTAATQLSVDEEGGFYLFIDILGPDGWRPYDYDNTGCHVRSYGGDTPQETLRKALDVDEDGDIDADDVTLVRNALGQFGDGILNTRTDINCDKIVDDTDLSLVDDTDPPVPGLSVPIIGDPAETFRIYINFEEVVYDFDLTDIVFTDDSTAEATIAYIGWSALSSGSNVYTFSVIPTTSGDLVISVPAGVTEDALGNKNIASVERTVTIDLTIPTVALSFSRTDDPSEMTVTITFSEAVSGFGQEDLIVSGSTWTHEEGWHLMTATSLSITSWETTDNTVFTAKITSDTSGYVRVQVPAGVATDSDGKTNTAFSAPVYEVDLDSPTVTVSVPTETQSGAFDITIYFNEGVYNFEQTDVSLANSTASATITDWESLRQFQTWRYEDKSVYKATITPTTSGTVAISIPASVTNDSFGNENVASDSYSVTVSLPGGNAPSAVLSQVMELLDTASLESLNLAQLEEQLRILRVQSDGSAEYLQAIALLERTLAALRPEKTVLLANYPNPFNPETWIPYHLANAGEVRITIYDARGTLVRQLDLGHQREGFYTNRSRAAYWDGRNNFGEPVASGIYFYQLEADNLSLLRKMLILK